MGRADFDIYTIILLAFAAAAAGTTRLRYGTRRSCRIAKWVNQGRICWL
jgi:hypothetical protein